MDYSDIDNPKLSFFVYLLQTAGGICVLASIVSFLFQLGDWARDGEWHSMPWFEVLFGGSAQELASSVTDYEFIADVLFHVLDLDIYLIFFVMAVFAWVCSKAIAAWAIKNRKDYIFPEVPLQPLRTFGNSTAYSTEESIDTEENGTVTESAACNQRDVFFKISAKGVERVQNISPKVVNTKAPAPRTMNQGSTAERWAGIRQSVSEPVPALEGVIVHDDNVPTKKIPQDIVVAAGSGEIEDVSFHTGHASAYRPQRSLLRRRLIRYVTIALLSVLAGYAVWQLAAPVRPPLLAVGEVKISVQKEIITNSEPGYVQRIYATDGDTVRPGDSLVQLLDASRSTEIVNLRRMLYTLWIQQARLNAEAQGSQKMQIPVSLVGMQREPIIQHLLDNEQKILDSRAITFQSETGTLGRRIEEDERQYIELQSQREALQRSLDEAAKRLQSTKVLLDQGVVYDQGIYVGALYQQLEVQAGELKNNIAGNRETATDVEQRIKQNNEEKKRLEQEYQGKIKEESARINSRIVDVLAQIEQIKRIDSGNIIKAPYEGKISRIHRFKVGDELVAGTPLFHLERPTGSVRIEVPLDPKTRDMIAIGSQATVKFSSGHQGNLYEIAGVVGGLASNQRAHTIAYIDIPVATYESIGAPIPSAGSKVEIKIILTQKMQFKEYLSAVF